MGGDIAMIDAQAELAPCTLPRDCFNQRIRNALAVLSNSIPASLPRTAESLNTYSLALALLSPDINPLQLYRAAACLREGDIKEVVQFLIFAGPAALIPALRLLNVMRGLPGNWELTMELLEQQTPKDLIHLEQRGMTFLALLGGNKIYHLLDWSEMLKQAAQDTQSESALAMHMVLERKWTGRKEAILQITSWGGEDDHSVTPSIWRELKWASYARSVCMDVATAEESSAVSSTVIEVQTDCIDNCFKSLSSECGPASQHYIAVCDIMMRRRRAYSNIKNTGPGQLKQPDGNEITSLKADSFVITPGLRNVIWATAKAISYGRPVLLEGESGCGKTSILALLARQTAYDCQMHESEAPGVTFIQMDSAMAASDGDTFSSLVGGIVPLPQGGGFRWRPGPIGLAVEKGEWLVFENLGKASRGLSSAIAVISQLAGLCLGDTLSAPGRGEPLVVGKGFRCIATRTIVELAEDNSWEPPGGWNTWERISMPAFSTDDQVDILQRRFPVILDCIERVVHSVSNVTDYVSDHRGPLTRKPSLREAVRVCKRLSALRSEDVELLSVENAFLETLDVLVAWCPSEEYMHSLLSSVATTWSLTLDAGQKMLSQHRPPFSCQGFGLRIGRASMPRSLRDKLSVASKLTLTGHTLRLLERVLRSLQVGEHVLLTGEAGSGKTAIVQEVAGLLGKRLVVANLSRQSELSDLVGGFRPVELAAVVPMLAKKFEKAFCKSMSRTKNIVFLDALQRASRSASEHVRAINLMKGAVDAIPRRAKEASEDSSRMWADIAVELQKISLSIFPSPIVNCLDEVESMDEDIPSSPMEPTRKRQKVASGDASIQTSSSPPENRSRVTAGKRKVDFQFADGVLAKAMREGDWILLDEINLAPAELLERLVSVVDRGQVLLQNENGDVLTCSKGFRLFGAMNPPTDVGKHPLPAVLRTRFTELYCGDMSEYEDIKLLVIHRFFREKRTIDDLKTLPTNENLIAEAVASFFIECCVLGRQGRIEDLNGRPVRFSLRTLSRMLDYASGVGRYMNRGPGQIRRALYEGAILAFATPAPTESRKLVTELAVRLILQKSSKVKRVGNMSDEITNSRSPQESLHFIEGFALATVVGKSRVEEEDPVRKTSFVISPSVKKTLQDVCRALALGSPRMPIVLQGPTASGKTSLVTYLSRITGNDLVRINNHEHTDLTEYIGGYVTTPNGALVFHEGPLISAARNGSWVLLDELNLAPPEVLESLNRLLDDNREILIPETGEVVKASDGFTVFATQNPPGLYGGRKELSRAFRSRFIEVQVADLPDEDLRTILENRCNIPNSFAKKMISVMRELQIRRRNTNMFSGRDGFVTARDLFRWASRGPRSREELALHGFFLLGERSRVRAERETVRTILLNVIGVEAVALQDENLYPLFGGDDRSKASQECLDFTLQKLGISREHLLSIFRSESLVLTFPMRRMMILVLHAMANSEPFLLVGATGGGKTSCCSAICKALKLHFYSVSCHQHTEASDVIGSFRPVHSRVEGDPLFEWVDGPLVRAMKHGSAVLIDEINMAEDSVIERLNSVLELERTLLLSEKGAVSTPHSEENRSSLTVEVIQADISFRIMATMNPGGDFGKKELSPALRNRFTEIWIPPVSTMEEFVPLVRSSLSDDTTNVTGGLRAAGDAICNFLRWVLGDMNAAEEKVGPRRRPCRYATTEARFAFSVRDVSMWCDFIKGAVEKCNMHPLLAFVHGARLVFLDGLSVGSSSSCDNILESELWAQLIACLPHTMQNDAQKAAFRREPGGHNNVNVSLDELEFGGFRVPHIARTNATRNSSYSFEAPCTIRNTARLARAMIIGMRPILLEGPPGCGKSSLVTALAEKVGLPFMRINLSNSTEMSDLVGTDAPGKVAGTFSFRKGPLLTALEHGAWLLLDELNLASQSVLEGLNSVLDHRRSLYVPELGKEVHANTSFRIFGAQNPAVDGGGRRGLPKSFLNRFTKVQVEEASAEDIAFIVKSLHPAIAETTATLVIQTLGTVKSDLEGGGRSCDLASLGLRDALRWCDLINGACYGGSTLGKGETDNTEETAFYIGLFFDIVVLQGLGYEARVIAAESFRKVFGRSWQLVSGVPSVCGTRDGRFRIGGSLAPSFGNNFSYQGLDSMSTTLSPTRFRELQALSFSVDACWPAVVYTDPGISIEEATGLVHTLATMSGKRLRYFRGSSFSDLDEFVGGYIQQDAVWLMKKICVISEDVVRNCLHTCVHSQHMSSEISFTSMDEMNSFQTQLRSLSISVESSSLVMGTVLDTFLNLSEGLQRYAQIIAGNDPNTATLLSQLQALLSNLRDVQEQSLDFSVGSFEWTKSDFIEAIEKGEWVVLLDADMCPPAVLDRLNPLLERPPVVLKTGERSSPFTELTPIVLAEAPPNEDGSAVLMSPHADFRVFFLCQSTALGRGQQGLSRALLDRSLKIVLSVPELSSTAAEVENVAEAIETPIHVTGRSGVTGLRKRESSSLRFILTTQRACVTASASSNIVEAQESGTNHVRLHQSAIQSPGVADFALNPIEMTTEREVVALQLVESMPLRELGKLLPSVTGILADISNSDVLRERRGTLAHSEWVRALVVRNVGERFILSSCILEDLSRRCSVLAVRAKHTSTESVAEVYERLCEAAKVIQGQLTTGVSGVGDVEGVLFGGFPLDAVYAGDEGTFFLCGNGFESRRGSAASLAKQFRVHLSCVYNFKMSWHRAEQMSRFAANENSLFAKGCLSNDVGNESMGDSKNSIEVSVYRILAEVAVLAEEAIAFANLSVEWEFPEENVFTRLLLSGKEMCDLATGTNTPNLAEVQCRVTELADLLIKFRDRTTSAPPLSRQWVSKLVSDLSRWKIGDDLGRVTNMPRTESVQKIEADVLAAESSRSAGLLDFRETDGLVKALVSLRTGTVEKQEGVLDVLKKVSITLSRSKASNDTQWQGLKHWSLCSLTHGINCFQDAMIVLLQTELQGGTASVLEMTKRALDHALLQLKCLPQVSLSALVGLQGSYWLMDALQEDSSNMSTRLVHQQVLSMTTASLMAEKAALCSPSCEDSDEKKESAVPSYLFSALRSYRKSSSESIFWNMEKARRQAISATTCIAIGGHIRKDNLTDTALLLEKSLDSAVAFAGLIRPISQKELSCAPGASLQALLVATKKKCDVYRTGSDMGQLCKLQLDAIMKSITAIKHQELDRSTFDVSSSTNREIEIMGTTGQAWVALAILRLRAFYDLIKGCDGIDPSDVALASANLSYERSVQASASIAAHVLFGQCRLGGEHHAKSNYVNRMTLEYQHAVNMREKAEERCVFRPKDRPSFNSFLSTVDGIDAVVIRKLLRNDLVTRLVTLKVVRNESILQAKEEALDIYNACVTAAETLGLTGSLSHFRDLSADLVLGLRELQYGLACCLKAAELSLLLRDRGNVVVALSNITLFPNAAFTQTMNAQQLIQCCISANLKTDELLAFAAYAVDTALQGFQADHKIISKAFGDLVTIWKNASLRDEEETIRKSSLHVLREAAKKDEVSGYSFIQNLEVDEDQDFIDTFNPIDEELEQIMLGMDLNFTGDSVGKQLNGTVGKKSKQTNINQNEFWKLHERVFSGFEEIQAPLHEVRSRLSVLQSLSIHLMSIVETVYPVTDLIPVVWGLFSSLGVAQDFEQDVIHSEQRSSSNQSSNFYIYSNPAQLLVASNALQKLHIAASRIQKVSFLDTGGHPVLSEVMSAITRVANNCRLSLPLSNVVPGIENVLRKVNEWRKLFATAATKMDEEVMELSQVVAHWRRLEMDSWKVLLDTRIDNAAARANKWFFFLYDAIINEAASEQLRDSSTALNGVTSVIDQFLRSSPTGEFHRRLNMVQSLSNHVCAVDSSLEGTVGRLGLVLRGIARYYSLYAMTVEVEITNTRRALQKKLDEFSRLQSWNVNSQQKASQTTRKDVALEYHRLKTQAERTKRKLHKLCLEMDSFLRVPVYEHMTKKIGIIGFMTLSEDEKVIQSKTVFEGSKASKSHVRSHISKSINEFISKLHGSDANSDSFPEEKFVMERTGTLLSRLTSFETKIRDFGKLLQTSKSAQCDSAVKFAEGTRSVVRSRAQHLRQSGDGVQPKKRALVELMKALQKAGLTPFESKVSSLAAEPSLWLCSPDPSQHSPYNSVANNLFYVAAQRLRRLREVSDSRVRSSDITGDEAQKLRAFCSHLFEQACVQRNSLRELNNHVVHIVEVTATLQSTSVGSKDLGKTPDFTEGSVLLISSIMNRLKMVCVDFEATAVSIKCGTEYSGRLPTVKSLVTSDVLVARQLSLSQQVSTDLSKIIFAATDSMKQVLSSVESTTLVDLALKGPIIMDSTVVSACSKIQDYLTGLRSELENNLHKAKTLSLNNVGVRMIEGTVQFVLESANALENTFTRKATGSAVATAESFRRIEAACELLVERTLVGAQNVLSWNHIDIVRDDIPHSNEELKIDVNDEESLDTRFARNVMKKAHNDLTMFQGKANLDQIGRVLKQIIGEVRYCFTCNASQSSLEHQLRNTLGMVRAAVKFVSSYVKLMILPCLRKVCFFHCQSLEFLRTLLSVFAGICLEGYCRPDGEVVDGDMEENVADISGAGFGEAGEGDMSAAQDVSEQIEDEEQLLGLQNDKQEETEQKETNDGDENDGFEMTADFEGDLQDVDKTDADSQSNENEELEESLAMEQGKGDNAIDERLWNDVEEKQNSADADQDEPVATPAGNQASSELVANENNDAKDKGNSNFEEKGDAGKHDITDGKQESEELSDTENDDGNNGLEEVPESNHGDKEPETKSKKSRVDDNGENVGEENEGSKDDAEKAGENAPDSDEMNGEETILEDQVIEQEAEALDNGQEDDVVMSGTRVDHIDGEQGNPSDGDADMAEPDDEELPNDLSLSDGEKCSDDDNEIMGGNIENDSLGSNQEEGNVADMDAKGMDVERDDEENIRADDCGEENVADDRLAVDMSNSRANDASIAPYQLDAGTITTLQNMPINENGESASVFPVPDKPDTNTAGYGEEGNDEDGIGTDGKSSGAQGEGASETFQQGKPNTESQQVKESSILDPNPHRALPIEEIVKDWSRFLETVKDAGESTGNPNADESNQDNGVWEFEKDGEPGAYDKLALGAATDEQHRPLPSNEIEEDNDETPVAGKKNNDEKNQNNISDGISAKDPPGPDVSQFKSLPVVEEDNRDEETDNSHDLRPHPVRSALEGQDDRRESTDVPLSKFHGQDKDKDKVEVEIVEGSMKEEGGKNAISQACETEKLSDNEAAALWRKLDRLTVTGASTLCEQLRLVLEPTVATGLAGGYRTGKRLNIRRVIEFVASDFRKDRIWLRRVRPDKRSYDVLLAIDDSESMSESGAGPMAIEALALITSALSKLEVGRLAVARFGAEACMVHGFDESLPLSDAKGGQLLQQFQFSQKETDIANLLEFVGSEMCDIGSSGDVDHVKLAFVISDGRLSGRDEIRRHLRRLKDWNVLVALIIVDKVGGKESSIFDVRKVAYGEKGAITIVPYMEDFPINYYAVVHDVKQLPIVLADALRQWIEMSSTNL